MSKVKYKVTIEPLTTVDAVGGSYAAHDIINQDIGKKLSATADVTVDTAAHTTIGYADGTVAYIEAADGAKTQLGADNTAYDFIYIKHTGFIYSSATAVGNVATELLDVYIETSAGSTYIKICSIPAGGAICLPNFPAQGANLGIHVQPASGSNHIAVEYALIT